ncbi:MAG: hypothetical protein JOY51_00925, partial [Nevskia sp.]|nr:hypothetical protein [Nevskia sp.]
MSMEFKAPMGWHIAYGLSSFMLLAASAIIVLRDYDPPWMHYQSGFYSMFAGKLQAEYAKAQSTDPKSDKTQDLYNKMLQVQHASMEIKQLYLGSTQWLSEYKSLVERVDRCSTCHMAVDYAIQASFKSAAD